MLVCLFSKQEGAAWSVCSKLVQLSGRKKQFPGQLHSPRLQKEVEAIHQKLAEGHPIFESWQLEPFKIKYLHLTLSDPARCISVS